MCLEFPVAITISRIQGLFIYLDSVPFSALSRPSEERTHYQIFKMNWDSTFLGDGCSSKLKEHQHFHIYGEHFFIIMFIS